MRFSARRGHRVAQIPCQLSEPLERRVMLSTVTWIGGNGGSWFSGNWSPGPLPGVSDDVVIPPGTGTILVPGTSVNIHSLVCGQALSISNASFNVATTAQLAAPVTIAGANLVGGTWTFSGSGNGIVEAANSIGQISSATVHGDLWLTGDNAALMLGGNTTFQDAHLRGNNAVLSVSPQQAVGGNILFEGPGGTRYLDMDGQTDLGTGTLTVAPTGSIRTASGFSGAALVGGQSRIGGYPMKLVNQGAISSESAGGTISLGFPVTLSGSGTLAASGGGTLTLDDDWSSSHAAVAVNDGTLNLGGAFSTSSIASFSHTGGTVNLTGTLSNLGTLTLDNNTGTWNLLGGTIQSGTLDFADGQTLAITPNANNDLEGVTINGDLSLTQPGAMLNLGRDTTFHTMHLIGDSTEIACGSVSGEVSCEGAAGNRYIDERNGGCDVSATGSIVTTPGFTGDVYVGGRHDQPLPNAGLGNGGTIDVEGGVLHLLANASNTGIIRAENGSILDISGVLNDSGTLALDSGATLTGSCQLTVNRGSVTFGLNATPVTDSIQSLAIVNNGSLDLGNNALRINYGSNPSPALTIRAMIANNYDGNSSYGGGSIISSVAASQNGRFAIGYADGAEGVVSGLGPHTLLVKYAPVGDLNLDGSVNFADLLALAQNYGSPAAAWDRGDLDYNGTVEFSDLLLLAQNYGQHSATASPDASRISIRLSARATRKG